VDDFGLSKGRGEGAGAGGGRGSIDRVGTGQSRERDGSSDFGSADGEGGGTGFLRVFSVGAQRRSSPSNRPLTVETLSDLRPESPKVVGDNVMLAMATSSQLNGPIKLLFPRTEAQIFSEGGSYPFELLGLGDVALPGLLACLALRYDASRTIDIQGRAVACAKALEDAMQELDPKATTSEIMNSAADAIDTAYDEAFDDDERRRESGVAVPEQVSQTVLGNRNFFFPVLGAYGLGLFIAFEANRITHLGQPALLYLVPCTLGAIATTAFIRGESARLWSFTDRRAGPTLKELWQKVDEKRT